MQFRYRDIVPRIVLLSIVISIPAAAMDTLFIEDFFGDLSTNWIFYGDPFSQIDDAMGQPPPSFNNNGDSMAGSGVVSREIFEIGAGFFVESDMYLSCHERGTWVTAAVAIVTPGFRQDDNTIEDYWVARIILSFSGEMDWSCPHRQAVLSFACLQDLETVFQTQAYHQNHLLNRWHSFRMEINQDRSVSYFIDDSLYCVSPVSIPDTLTRVRIKLGNRSSVWGMALHDNIIIGWL